MNARREKNTTALNREQYISISDASNSLKRFAMKLEQIYAARVWPLFYFFSFSLHNTVRVVLVWDLFCVFLVFFSLSLSSYVNIYRSAARNENILSKTIKFQVVLLSYIIIKKTYPHTHTVDDLNSFIFFIVLLKRWMRWE
jgi:hypothetical protein